MEPDLQKNLRYEAERLGPGELTEFLESLLYMLAYHIEAGYAASGTHHSQARPTFEWCRDEILADLGASGVEAEMQTLLINQYGPPCYAAARRILGRQQSGHRFETERPPSAENDRFP